jgi:hypothetical protein
VHAVGEALETAEEEITKFFTEDIVEIGDDIGKAVGGWGEDFTSNVDDFAQGAKDIFSGEGLLNLMFPSSRRVALIGGNRLALRGAINDYRDIGRLLLYRANPWSEML